MTGNPALTFQQHFISISATISLYPVLTTAEQTTNYLGGYLGNRSVAVSDPDLQRTEIKEKAVVGGYKKIEDGVVRGYKKIENGVVDGFNKITDKFVDSFLTEEGESVEDARKRLSGEKDGEKAEEK